MQNTYRTKLKLDKEVGGWGFADEMGLRFGLSYVITYMTKLKLDKEFG